MSKFASPNPKLPVHPAPSPHLAWQPQVCSLGLWVSFSSTDRFIYAIRYFFYFSLLFRAPPVAYGGSQVAVQIRAAAASLHHNHSNVRSKPYLRPTPTTYSSRQRRILNPLSEARDQTCVLMDPSWIRFCCTTTGIPVPYFRFHI